MPKRKDGKKFVTVRRIAEELGTGATVEQVAKKLGVTVAEIDRRLASPYGKKVAAQVEARLKVQGRLLMARSLVEAPVRLAKMVDGEEGADQKKVVRLLGRMFAAEKSLEAEEGVKGGAAQLPEEAAGVMDSPALEELGREAERELEENAEE